METKSKLKIFYITSVFSMIFAVLGFSYNTWRMELSEENNNIRTAAFEVLLQLAELEQVIYAAHYDKNEVEGSPRKAWVKVGLIVDLSMLIAVDVEMQAKVLKSSWAEHWQLVPDDQAAVDTLVKQIDQLRNEINIVLKSLQ